MSTTEQDRRSTPSQYRLTVGSATEAVRLVRDRFGTTARVLAVRQIEAVGLARFVRRPRLEVIVEVEPRDATTPVARCEANAGAATPPDRLEDRRADGADGAAESAASIPSAAPRGDRALAFLRASGLDESLLQRVRTDHPRMDWDRASAPEVLARLAVWLRDQFSRVGSRRVGRRRVFLGACGVGKTTALCKILADEVFVRRANVAVLKLDGEHPNATDGLAAFCDVCGAPLLRSAAEIEEFDADTCLLVDVPGMALDARSEHERMGQSLDALGVDTRVLVVNAGWESEVIADAYEMGRGCRATHVIFTHLDEVRCPGKLWRFALSGGLSPLAVCSGPSPAGEIDLDVFNALLSRSFPASLARAALADGGAG